MQGKLVLHLWIKARRKPFCSPCNPSFLKVAWLAKEATCQRTCRRSQPRLFATLQCKFCLFIENYANKVTAVLVIQCCPTGVVKSWLKILQAWQNKMSRQFVTVTIRRNLSKQIIAVPANCRVESASGLFIKMSELLSCYSKRIPDWWIHIDHIG